MENSKLKISEFEKYSLSNKSQTLIKGGLTYPYGDTGGGDPNDDGWDPNDPQNGTGNGGPTGTTSVIPPTIKEEEPLKDVRLP